MLTAHLDQRRLLDDRHHFPRGSNDIRPGS
ncbi:MAG: hypothetical protein QOC54_291, partial [Baekduia sp.]|nr:hypothetical protein [Baekduia sp.]